MNNSRIKSTERFSNRVEYYVKFRPGYPENVIKILEKQAGLTPASVIVDIGSGTGISTELFLNYGNTVYAVEPNDQMRQTAESRLKKNPKFHSIKGTAEATNVRDNSADLVVAAQAFHWFDMEAARLEFARILKPEGYVALIWNSRRVNSSDFLRACENFLDQYGTDYQDVNHRNLNENELRDFFKTSQKDVVYNEQLLSFEGFIGRLLSSSYIPAEGHPGFETMFGGAEQLFKKYNEKGQVKIEYDTELYIGTL